MGNEVFDLPDGLWLKTIRQNATRPPGLILQRDLAARMGVTRGRVSQIESTAYLREEIKGRYLDALASIIEGMGT